MAESEETKVARMQDSIRRMEADIVEIREGLKELLAQSVEQKLVKNVVFGLVGLVLTTVGGAIVALILKQ